MLVDRLLWRVIPDIKTTVGNTDFQFFPCMHLVCLPDKLLILVFHQSISAAQGLFRAVCFKTCLNKSEL